MKKALLVGILSACFVNLSFSQESAPAPSSPPASSPPAAPAPSTPAAPTQQSTQQNTPNVYQQDSRPQRNILREQDLFTRQMLELSMENQQLYRANVRQDIDTIYRRTNKKEMKVLNVNEGDKQKYGLFLKTDKTGLIKLISDLGCSANTKVLVANEQCLKYSMPGGGSSYSFRVEDYRIPQLADLTFFESTFEASGILSHGIFTGIGDVPLENVTLQSPGVKYISEIAPVTKYEEAVKFHDSLSKGMVKDKLFYSSRVKALENMTYVLRSIAYEGQVPKAINGITYNELDFDKRKDVLIAFRIVRKEDDGSITVLWKELARLKSPKMEQRKKEDKENNDSKNKLTAKN